MKIAFLTPEYPHSKTGKSGGIGTSIFNLSKALNVIGNRVTVIVYGQDKDEHFVEDGLNIYKVKNIKVKGLSLFLTQNKVSNLINNLVKKNEVEIVEAPDWTGFTSFINPKCPLVIRQNGSDTYFCHLEQRKVKFKNKFMEKRALSRADGIISVSAFTGKLTNELMNLNLRFEVIPNSIDTELFAPKNKQKHKKTILYFGTLIRKKGLFELPHIFNLVNEKDSEVSLILIGKDSGDIKTDSVSTWELIKPLFTEKSLENVSYFGEVSYSKIQDFIEKASVCVFPTFAEALPVSWLEAMAMEKAIVASNIGWAEEMIVHGTEGFLVHPENHQVFANCIQDIIESPEKQLKFGRAARKKVMEKFNHELVATKSIAFYKKVLNDFINT